MTDLIKPEIEQILRNTILPDLLKGRKDFDLPHTEAVVYWMKTLLAELPSLDAQVLITAAYGHDWGYIGLFDGVDSNDPVAIGKMKPLHMERGAEMMENLIKTLLMNHFSNQQMLATIHLIAMHDKVEELVTEEEITIMEADTLGMLDTSRVKPTFSKTDNDRFIELEIKNRRLPRFIHQIAIKNGVILAKQRADFFQS